MTDYTHIISNEDKNLLAGLRGKTLEYVEGYRNDFDNSSERTSLYSTARLHFGSGNTYDLRVKLIRVDFADNLWDDVGVYSFSHAEGGIWLPEGVKAFKLPICRTIDEIVLVNDYDELMHGSEMEATFAFTKAVLFRTGLEYIALAIDDFMEDSIIVRRGFNPEKLIPDGSGSWYEEPGWTDNYSRKYESL